MLYGSWSLLNIYIMLDNIKAKGYHYSSIGAVTVASIRYDSSQKKKYELLKEADKTVDKIEKMYRRGFISE